jgi:hypothetical protein
MQLNSILVHINWNSAHADGSRVCTLGIDRYIGLPIYLANTDTDTDISVSANWISVSAYRYRYRLSAKKISAISVSAKNRLQILDIGQNIGLYRPFLRFIGL